MTVIGLAESMLPFQSANRRVSIRMLLDTVNAGAHTLQHDRDRIVRQTE